MLHFSINWTFKMRYHINFYLTWHRNYQTNKMQSNYFIKIGLPRGLSFWAVPAATPIESNFTKKRPTELSVKSIDVKINCLPYQNWFFKLYMLNKKDIVAFYHTEIVKVFIFLTLRLISIFFCLLNSVPASLCMENENENWADRSKKVNLKLKSFGFKSKSFSKLKFQIDYKVRVVKKIILNVLSMF